MHCGIEIPPTWVAALNSNICPSCGEPIMDDGAQELIKDLAEAMKQMPNNPQGLAGWLVSNYRMQKIGEYEPVNFTNPKKTPPGSLNPNASESNKYNALEGFFQRAGVKIDDVKQSRASSSDISDGGSGGSGSGSRPKTNMVNRSAARKQQQEDRDPFDPESFVKTASPNIPPQITEYVEDDSDSSSGEFPADRAFFDGTANMPAFQIDRLADLVANSGVSPVLEAQKMKQEIASDSIDSGVGRTGKATAFRRA